MILSPSLVVSQGNSLAKGPGKARVVVFVSQKSPWHQPKSSACCIPPPSPFSLSLSDTYTHSNTHTLSPLLKSLCTLIHKPCLCHVIQHFKYTAHFLPATECPKEEKIGSMKLRFQLVAFPFYSLFLCPLVSCSLALSVSHLC